ncbi:MAG: hypothetical protein ACTIDY_01530 [Halomonadaceae bacterium]|uniref:Uncharacterized protein n=1 Tax=Halomonas colorata TaxID=2742615 RepID=A0ABR9FU03_9GAMM|nr:hypothetical protein [Halomonas colorata]MBE0462097.1 hypothetical protein [Halomonas colorata]
MTSKEEAQNFIDELTAKVGEPEEFTFLIPGWEPVDSKQGLWWITSQLWEGFYVAYQIDSKKKLVYLKSWEFGEDEPEWPISV